MKTAIILSGCGNRDGSELQESLSLMLAIDRKGWEYQCFAPEGLFNVVPHLDVTEEEEDGTVLDADSRDILMESARIARGNCKPLDDLKIEDYDALILPGGMGAARNLSTFAFDGASMEVIDGITDTLLAFYRAKKPIVALCIAPILLAKVLGRYGVHITFGGRCAAQDIATSFGAVCEPCDPTEACVDEENKVITSPAYMVATHISQIFDGSAAAINALDKMTH